jgi:hypothetical protein
MNLRGEKKEGESAVLEDTAGGLASNLRLCVALEGDAALFVYCKHVQPSVCHRVGRVKRTLEAQIQQQMRNLLLVDCRQMLHGRIKPTLYTDTGD